MGVEALMNLVGRAGRPPRFSECNRCNRRIELALLTALRRNEVQVPDGVAARRCRRTIEFSVVGDR